MDWVAWVEEEARGGSGLPERVGAEVIAGFSRVLLEHDAAVVAASERPDQSRTWMPALGTSVKALSRATASLEARCLLALAPAPGRVRARAAAGGWPRSCAAWFPDVPEAARSFAAAEALVHALAAEIRARLAGTEGGAARQQDLHVLLLCLRPGLWWDGAGRGYMKLVRQVCPGEEAAIPVAKCAIVSAFKAPSRARSYRALEWAVARTLGDLPPDRAEASRRWLEERRGASPEVVDRLAARVLEATERTREAHRLAREVEARPGEAAASAREALEASLAVARLASEVGVAVRVGDLAARREALDRDGAPADPAEFVDLARLAAKRATQMTSDLRSAAADLARTAGAPAAPSADAEGSRPRSLGELRRGLGLA